MNNRQITLKSRPVGIPQPAHFELKTVAVPDLNDGEFLVENHYLSVDPAQRGYVNDENNYAPPVPIGAVMRAMAVGQVIASKHADFAIGTFLYGWFGWQDYCVATPASVLRRVDPAQAPLSTGAGLLGINGLTAYLALHDIGNPKPGETVLVTAAAGAVGSIVGQLSQQCENDPDASRVEESDFRYPGPKPQTREAAVMMLADSVESACRGGCRASSVAGLPAPSWKSALPAR